MSNEPWVSLEEIATHLGVSKIACMRMIEALNAMDLGPAFDAEWRRRKTAFRNLVTGKKVSMTLRQIMQVAEPRMDPPSPGCGAAGTKVAAESWRGRRR
jgi:hypothetical protein